MAQLLTSSEVAKQLKVSEGTVRNWVHQKQIPYVKVNRSLRFDQDKIDHWLRQRSIRTKVGGMLI